MLLLLLQGATKAAELLASEATASAARVVDDAPALMVARVERACFSSALDGGPLLAEERRNDIPMLRFCAVLPPVELAKVTSEWSVLYIHRNRQANTLQATTTTENDEEIWVEIAYSTPWICAAVREPRKRFSHAEKARAVQVHLSFLV